jgi:hypothetical protein
MPSPQAVWPRNEKRNVGPEFEAKLREQRRGQSQAPDFIEGDQGRGRIRASAAKAALHRNVLGEPDVDAPVHALASCRRRAA